MSLPLEHGPSDSQAEADVTAATTYIDEKRCTKRCSHILECLQEAGCTWEKGKGQHIKRMLHLAVRNLLLDEAFDQRQTMLEFVPKEDQPAGNGE